MRFQRAWMTGTLALVALASAGAAGAQERAPKPNGDVVIEDKIAIEAARIGPMEGDVFDIAQGGVNTFVFLSSEMSFNNRVVKGAPYSAEATTETIQTLSDGNRIVRKNSATIYRDSEGRTRREQTLGIIGQWGAAGDPPRTVFIDDPVERVNYILDPKARTARKMTIGRGFAPGQRFEFGTRQPGEKFEVPAPPPPPGSVTVTAPRVQVFENTRVRTDRKRMSEAKTESLGRQNIEGVDAEGTRTTITIPAGQIGNERAIDIVTERWYSPELQTVVLSVRRDPMVGETTYKLTNINRAEPARSLFEVPGDYKIKEGPEVFFRRPAGKPDNQ